MATLGELAVDEKKEVEGIWVGYELGIKVLVAKAHNPRFIERLQKLMDLNRESINEGTASKDTYENILKQVQAETVLLGWKNITDKDGKEIPYTPEVALEIFKARKYKDFYLWIVGISEEVSRYRNSALKEKVGNLPSSSSGQSPGEIGPEK